MSYLSIGQYTALDVPVETFVDIAAKSECQAVSLLVRSPDSRLPLPIVGTDNLGSIRSGLQATGLSVLNIECFILTPATRIEDFRPYLELGARLNAVGVTALLYDSDEQRVAANLMALCGIAAEFNLRVNIEFMPFTPKWNTVAGAVNLVQQLQQPNLGLGVDLLHVVRSGGSMKDVAGIPDELIHSVQVCDSMDASAHSDYAEEAASQRLAPGEGVFPVSEFLTVLPSGTPIEIEVPQTSVLSAEERVRHIVSATRRQMTIAGLV